MSLQCVLLAFLQTQNLRDAHALSPKCRDLSLTRFQGERGANQPFPLFPTAESPGSGQRSDKDETNFLS